ncbi:hypothetical protein [Streptomyces jeddahensis]|uniref:Uncharacterized protein n=1 Tax=Streptomyces jeddahensis TaxID=1716141 RepID=A0A177HUI4_9ACTN|nr:hypothetical protein [Streptomyces jeddahensis]OAH14320.1 hypothetical protein STSP_23810 [Streptomyces jeddahensis]
MERDQEQLRRALPGLRDDKLLDVDAAAVRVTAWPTEPGAGPLKACPVCVEEGAWLCRRPVEAMQLWPALAVR